ncbi:DUF4236 domain-containing protein [Sphingomonas sp. 3-13AW]|uniref:DUF4236 domain-containing protein n=1 Tax=Sphingomonas sp. 3-13AW TaxID=3050450 RepID=UPI003BB5AA2A
MGFRFSKRLTIMPGVRLNLGLGGPSLSVGPRGASVSIGRKGVFGNVGIPGSGLSYRTRLDGGGTPGRSGASLPPTLMLEVRNGRVEFTDGNGRDIPDELRSAAVRENRVEAERMLEEQAEALARAVSVLTSLHLDTPSPASGESPATYAVPKPVRSDFADQEGYMASLMSWRAAKANYERSSGFSFEPSRLEAALSALTWPRETVISYDHSPDGRIVALDVDLPEIEDMPSQEASINRKALTIRLVDLSSKRVADLYSSHVASVVFLLAGTVFASSPAAEVRISGYTQRAGGTGRVQDEYVVAVTIPREGWSAIDFSALALVDPENALQRFGMRLERTGRGSLRTVAPCPAI